MPVSLSIEEQNVKNSILRLNERLNGKFIDNIIILNFITQKAKPRGIYIFTI